ncbi:MAG TPA: hypothetical protein VE988_16835 [Gemmataceae bacterium]|nr:hypothetical protein [Gemmataceae bacterium]
MTRNTVRNYLVLSSLVSLSLLHALWPTEASQPAAAFNASMLDTFVARNIGPANMGGRITAITGVETNSKIVYVAAASGGLWKTADGGNTWAPIFDHQTSVCIGDVAVSRSHPDIVWVGTGEHNPRNSVTWGDGVYKSTDGGKTWANMGLKDSHSTGRVVIHPTNPDVVYVGSLGHLWGPNKERGVFKTTDGGKTWQSSLFLDENTGIVDVKMDPTDPNTIYAAAYCCRRSAFSGGNPETVIGPKAGIYKTSDGGKSWDKLTVATPQSQYGRCGISIYRKNPNTVYAIVQTEQTPHGNSNEGGKAGAGGRPALGGIFRSDDKGKTWTHVNTLCPRPMYFGELHVDPMDDQRLYCLGVSMSLSNDGGKSWQTSKAGHADGHAVWINPNDNKEVWVGNDGGFVVSKNRAQSFQVTRAMTICQFYGISVDMSKPYYVYGGLQDNGSHGGPSATYDSGGIPQNRWFNIGGGDGFHTACDPNDPNTVYSETQWGGFKRVNVAGKGKGKIEIEDVPVLSLLHSLFPRLVPTSFPGNAREQAQGDQKKDDPKKDEPKKDEPQKKGGMGGKAAGRYNWSSPMHISPHDSKTIYFGAQFLQMSTQRGDNFQQISPDLTYGAVAGKDTKGHTLFTIAESPKKKGVLWTGADDGRINVSQDGGKTWKDVSKIPGMLKEGCVSRVEPSAFEDGTCYVSITRYRNDDRKPYIFKTTNYGESWENITGNLPQSGSVHVVIESSKNRKLLFCGTEFGLFVSLEGGKVWHQMKGSMPTVAVHDLIIHPRDRDLVIGTHGRGIWIMDDISPLEALTPDVLAKPDHLFHVRPTVAFKVRPSGAKTNAFVGQNPPYGAIIRYKLMAQPGDAPVTIHILDNSGKHVAMLKANNIPGLNQVVWNLRADGQNEATVAAGEYTAVMEAAGKRQMQKVRVEAEK